MVKNIVYVLIVVWARQKTTFEVSVQAMKVVTFGVIIDVSCDKYEDWSTCIFSSNRKEIKNYK